MSACRVMQSGSPHSPLVEVLRPMPRPGESQVRIRVEACGVCRTDLHVVDGELPQATYPIVPGHEVVGIVEAVGHGVHALAPGERVGVPWLAHTCGHCEYCRSDRENLCDDPQFVGCTRDGGFATHLLADADFCIRLDASWTDPAATAPLLCAGLIGWRAFRAAGPCRTLGLYGFGAAAHILAQLAIARGIDIHAFTRPGDVDAQAFARSLGAQWAGGSDEVAPQSLDAAIIFAPVGALIPAALRNVRKGGRVVCAGIHMSDVPAFSYALLWEERHLVSVANLTREDARSFFAGPGAAGVRVHVSRYRLRDANLALDALRQGRVQGAAVLVPE